MKNKNKWFKGFQCRKSMRSPGQGYIDSSPEFKKRMKLRRIIEAMNEEKDLEHKH